MKILITGINGFVGSNLFSKMKDHHEIYGLDIVANVNLIKTYSWKDLDEGNLPDVDAIIHLAGKAHDTKNKSGYDVYFKVNTELTKKIFDYFIKSSAKKFIFFSTAKAAADKVEGVLTENVIPTPVGPYGESKIKAEEYIKANMLSDKYVYILRPCMIHGPGNKGNLNLLYKFVSKGFPWPLGSFDNKRTFTSVGNICFVVENLLMKNVTSGIYNMGDDEPISTNELIELICESIGKKTHIWHFPKGLIICLAEIGGLIKFPLNKERLRKLTENYISSNAKIKKALGIEKMPIKSREGLKVTLKSFTLKK